MQKNSCFSPALHLINYCDTLCAKAHSKAIVNCVARNLRYIAYYGVPWIHLGGILRNSTLPLAKDDKNVMQAHR